MIFMDNSSIDPAKETIRRLFFAIIPDKNALQAIEALQAQSSTTKARFIPREKMHITLLFLGNLTGKQINCLQSTAQQIKAKSLHLRFDHCGIFKKTQIWWLGQNTIDEHMLALNEELKTLASKCNIVTEKRAFKPHITLARKYLSNQFARPETPVAINVNNFYLMESIFSDNNVRYEIVDSYPLY